MDSAKKIILCDNENLCAMNMTGLNVRKISNKLFIEDLPKVRKRTFYMQGYFSSYPNDVYVYENNTRLKCHRSKAEVQW